MASAALVMILMALLLHPVHESLAEGQWNADRTALQVSLRLAPRDLDEVLSKRQKRAIRLEKESPADTEKLLVDYLVDRFFLDSSTAAENLEDPAASDARRKRFRWVGVEREVRFVWVYFEIQPPISAGPQGETEEEGRTARWWLHNRVMFEIDARQINTFQLLRSNPPVSVRTTRERPAGVLSPAGVSSPAGVLGGSTEDDGVPSRDCESSPDQKQRNSSLEEMGG